MSRGRIASLALATALLSQQASAAPTRTHICEPANLKRLAGWSGIWVGENLESDINGRELPGANPQGEPMKFIGLDAPWKDAAWDKLEIGLRPGSDATGIITSWGFPVMMSAPSPFTIIVSPAETVIVSQYREIRYIYTDGRQHPSGDNIWPTLWGDSVGCWHGDTLVIDTIAVHYSPESNYASPPLSDNAHFVERMRQTGPNRIESDVTITDPETLERPWQVHMVYNRHPILKRLVHEGDILANNRIVDENGHMTIAGPNDQPKIQPVATRPEVKLSPVELDRLVGKYRFDGAPLVLTAERRGDRLFVRIDPPQPVFLPVHAADASTFFSRMQEKSEIHFTMGPDGTATGLTGTDPNGQPISAKRVTQPAPGGPPLAAPQGRPAPTG